MALIAAATSATDESAACLRPPDANDDRTIERVCSRPSFVLRPASSTIPGRPRAHQRDMAHQRDICHRTDRARPPGGPRRCSDWGATRLRAGATRAGRPAATTPRRVRGAYERECDPADASGRGAPSQSTADRYPRAALRWDERHSDLRVAELAASRLQPSSRELPAGPRGADRRGNSCADAPVNPLGGPDRSWFSRSAGLALTSVLFRACAVARVAQCEVAGSLVGAVVAGVDVAAGDVDRNVGVDRVLVGFGA